MPLSSHPRLLPSVLHQDHSRKKWLSWGQWPGKEEEEEDPGILRSREEGRQGVLVGHMLVSGGYGWLHLQVCLVSLLDGVAS